MSIRPKNLSRSFLYHPVLHTFFLPFAQIFFGTAYASRFTTIQLLPYLAVYSFLLINKLLETQMTQQASSANVFLPRTPIFLEAANIGLLIYFWLNSSTTGLVFPLGYTLLVHFQYLFLAYDSGPLALVLLSLFKGIGGQIIVFYLFLNFLPATLLLWSLPLVLPLFLLETHRWERVLSRETTIFKEQIPTSLSFIETHKQVRFNSVSVLSFFVGILVLWQQAGWLALLLLILLPLVRTLSSYTKKMQQKKLQLFFFGFSGLYTLIWVLHYTPR